MRLGSAFLGLVAVSLLAGCATADEKLRSSDAHIDKQKIAEATQPDDSLLFGFCPRPPVSVEAQEILNEQAQPLPTNDTITEAYSRFTKSLDVSKSSDERLQAYVSEVSFSSQPSKFQKTQCWTGLILGSALIGDLKHPNRTWTIVHFGSDSPLGGDRKCAYADDPNAWTYETCPAKGAI